MKIQIIVFVDDNSVPIKFGLNNHLNVYREYSLDEWAYFPFTLYLDGLSQKYLDKDGLYKRKYEVKTEWKIERIIIDNENE